MAERKRKISHDNKYRNGKMVGKKVSHSNLKTSAVGKKEKNRKYETRRRGPGLPNSLRKELGLTNAHEPKPLNEDEEVDFNIGNDVYEYEEAIPEEESRKNRRYGDFENFEEEPEQFEDYNVSSSDDDNDDADDDDGDVKDGENVDEVKDLRHAMMLQGITDLPSDIFYDNRKISNSVITEVYPESEYNPTRDVMDGEGLISIQDLLDPLHGNSGFSKLRKNIQRMERKSISTHAPLPKVERERLERKAAYEQSKRDITKWEPLVKRNRETPTLYFNDDTDFGFSTVGAIASEFKPRTEFEKKIASFVNGNEVVEAHKMDGARLLEMNEVSVKDVKERHNRLAKMRSLLFRHEMKSKRIKKIKSKTYHRLLKKDKLKTAAVQLDIDPEAVKDLARKQEFKRAEERMRLKHKNSSKWAKRILKRGLNVQDDGTRAAISEQLHQHALLTRKMNTMESSSSDDSSDDYDSDRELSGSDHDIASRLLEKAKEKTCQLLKEDDEVPKSGVLALPFMVRGLKKREEAANDEARLALQDYEASMKQLEDDGEDKSKRTGISSGRRVFGASTKPVQESRNMTGLDHDYDNTDKEDALEVKEDAPVGNDSNHQVPKDVGINLDLFHQESQIHRDSVFKGFDEIVKDPGCKTTYEVAIFATNTWKKKMNKAGEDSEQLGKGNELDVGLKASAPDQDMKDLDDSEGDSEGHMVDGILSSGAKLTYELPSQAELIRRAFAGDDVEEDFKKDKEEVLNEENPEPEKPMLLPGWGQWTDVQKKKGLPSWMLTEHASARQKREEAIKKRKDAKLKHVIISERLDKKAEKLHTKTLPYPYTSKEVFEQSMRMPIGPEFNPVSAVGALNRPEVVKKAGVIIKPIKYEDLNPHERDEGQKRGVLKQKTSGKSNNKDWIKKNTKGNKK